jgi:hypothetical protein
MVRDVVFAAGFAAYQMIQGQRIMSTTPVTTALGMFSFW